jgi:hypothetical protein
MRLICSLFRVSTRLVSSTMEVALPVDPERRAGEAGMADGQGSAASRDDVGSIVSHDARELPGLPAGG